MPNLSIVNNIISKPEHRQDLTIIEALFGSTTEGFAGNNATISLSGKKLVVLATDNDGYAYQSWGASLGKYPVTPGVTYTATWKWYQSNNPSTQGSGKIKLGSTDGGTEYALGEYGSGAVTLTQIVPFRATADVLYLRLQTNHNTKKTYWDNIIIKEWDGQPV